MTKIRDELHNKGGVKSVWVLEKECTGWDFKIIQKWSYKVTEPKWCVFVEIVEEIASNSKVSHSRKTSRSGAEKTLRFSAKYRAKLWLEMWMKKLID